jgi:aminomethyltransferase
MSNNRTVLYDIQGAQGAKMVDFHGWDMPVQFVGIIDEHRAVRSGCGLFDLGHMGRLSVVGSGATAFLDNEVCRPLASMKPGQVRYGLVCRADGGVDDDILVSREGDEAFHVVVNASNRQRILDRWLAAKPDSVTISDISPEQAMIAVQGPNSAALLAGLGLDPGDMRYYRFIDLEWDGVTVRLSRTGYTGEDGFECFLPKAKAEALWTAVHSAGATPCGLGARDTLRLEAGMPLYGNELDESHSPVEAGLEFAVAKKGGFIGAERLLAQIADGTERKLVGLVMEGRRAARHGYDVLDGERTVGTVTSGTWSPTLEQPIAMAYVESALAVVGGTLSVSLRGKATVTATVVETPFYKRS